MSYSSSLSVNSSSWSITSSGPSINSSAASPKKQKLETYKLYFKVNLKKYSGNFKSFSYFPNGLLPRQYPGLIFELPQEKKKKIGD